MKVVRLSSPAKLNLILNVLNKRPDGYHNLKTLFERVNLQDELEFSSNSTGKITISCDSSWVPTGPKNLVYKVAQVLKNDFHIREGVHVRITKRIPVAAGLAGGSSNAATALLGLDKLWKLSLPRAQLVKYARTVGSDVAFFLYDTNWAVGTSRGDVIKPVDAATKLWHVLVVPRIKMYSREVFTRLNLRLTKKVDNVNILIRSIRGNNILKAQRLLSNDLECSILTVCPRLEQIRARMRSLGLEGVSFSGSGPSIFALTDSQSQAQEAVRVLGKRYAQVFCVRTL